MLLIDRIAYDNRIINFAPELKSLLYVFLLVACFASPPALQGAIILIMAIVTIYLAKVTIVRYLKWLLIPLPFLAVSFITIILTVSSEQQDLMVSLPFFGNFLGVSPISWDMALHLFFRSFSCLTCTYFYALTTPFQQILKVMKRCHLPAFLIEITMLMYRFIFIFLDEVTIIKKAQEMRFGYHGLMNTYHSIGMMIRIIFQQTFDRFQKMNVSLEMKFFKGDFPL